MKLAEFLERVQRQNVLAGSLERRGASPCPGSRTSKPSTCPAKLGHDLFSGQEDKSIFKLGTEGDAARTVDACDIRNNAGLVVPKVRYLVAG